MKGKQKPVTILRTPKKNLSQKTGSEISLVENKASASISAFTSNYRCKNPFYAYAETLSPAPWACLIAYIGRYLWEARWNGSALD